MSMSSQPRGSEADSADVFDDDGDSFLPPQRVLDRLKIGTSDLNAGSQRLSFALPV